MDSAIGMMKRQHAGEIHMFAPPPPRMSIRKEKLLSGIPGSQQG